MAPKKKKKGKKKGKKSADKDPDAEDKPKYINEPPPYIDPVKDAQIAKLKLCLSTPPHQFLNVMWEPPVSTRLYMLFRKIKQLHGGSISDIRVTVHQYVDDQAYTDPSLTLRDIGICTEGEYPIYYDFKVSSAPLLNTPMDYKCLEEGERAMQSAMAGSAMK